jgi:hypothetical protein
MNMCKQSGATLVEFMLYIALASVLVGTIASVFVLLLDSQTKNDAIQAVTLEGGYAMNTILGIVREADAVVQPLVGVSGNTLVLQTGADILQIDVVDGVLRITDGVGTYTLTSADVRVSGFSVDNVSRAETAGTIRIQFFIETRFAGGQQQYQYGLDFVSGASLRS